MVAAQRTKVVDKQEVIKKVLVVLKKPYASVGLKPELPVLETMLYAICLENASPEEAEQGYARLLNGFQDLNEVRVSSIYELERVFKDMEQPDWRALRIKNVLQHLFETTYSFDFDSLKRKTHELATKQLAKIKSLSPFIRAFAQQNALGSHVLPVDEHMLNALIWLGLVDPGTTPEHASEVLRGFVRKADAQTFCHLLRCFATDKKFAPYLAHVARDPALLEADARSGTEKLEHMLRHGAPAFTKKAAPVVKDAPKKPVVEKSPEKHVDKHPEKVEKHAEKHPEKNIPAKPVAKKAAPAPVAVKGAVAAKAQNGAKKVEKKPVKAAKEAPAKLPPKKAVAAKEAPRSGKKSK